MSDLFIPGSPKSVPLRPLTKGMLRNLPPQMIPLGGAWDIDNLFVYEEGLTLRDGWNPLFSSYATYGKVNFSSTSAEQIQDVFTFFESDGSSASYLVLTNRRLYKFDTNTSMFEVVPYGQQYTLSSHAGAGPTWTITDSTVGRDFVNTEVVRVGDKARWHTATGWVEATISARTASQLTIDADPSAHDTNELYVVHEFQTNLPDYVDYTVTPTSVVFVDGKPNGILSFTGDYLNDMKVHGIAGDDVDYLLGASTCLYINGYLYLGRTLETGTDGRRLIRWSSATDLSEFAQGDYINFVTSATPVLKISSIENIPMVYTYDQIFAGFPSTFTGLPFQFVPMETGGVSAVGMRAMTSYLNGQLFVGRDNIYFIQPNRAQNTGTPVIEAIGDPISAIGPKRARYSGVSRAVYDPSRECVMFGLDVSSSKRIGEFYFFFPRTKAWSRSTTPLNRFVSLNIVSPFDASTWDSLDSTDWDGLDAITWADLGLSIGSIGVVTSDDNGFIYILDKNSLSDTQILPDYSQYSTNIMAKFESGDIDFGVPDDNKTVTRLGIKISDASQYPHNDITFTVETSTDSGTNWEARDDINIEQFSLKDECHFREKGSIFRFRVMTTTKSYKFRIDEILLRVKQGQREDVRD